MQKPNLFYSFKPTVNKHRVLFFSVCLLIIIPLIIDSYLIHRTYVYFGGGALNRPHALTSLSQYLVYFFEALIYDAFIYTLLVSLLFIFFSLFKKQTYSQRVFLSISLTSITYFMYTVISMQVLAYFGGHFDLKILKELTEGNWLSAFSFISLKQFLLGIILALIPITSIFLSYAIPGSKYHKIFDTIKHNINIDKRKYLYIFMIAIILIVINHSIVNNNKKLHHGLSQKFSYALLNNILQYVTDFDGDGFGPFTQVKDPNNFDANINSYAIDIPFNGFDENGLAGDFKNHIPKVQKTITTNNITPNKNVIVIVVETFRTDVISKKINGDYIMPFLSGLTKKHSYTKQMYSNYGSTAKAIQTIFTGKMDYNNPGNFSLFDYYRKFGYKVIAASAQSENWGNTDKILKFSQFDEYYDPRNKKEDGSKKPGYNQMKGLLATIDSSELNKQIFKMLETVSTSKFMMYINYQDLHYPYHSDEWERKFIDNGYINSGFFKKENRQKIIKQYANAAYHLDHSIKALFDKLEQLEMLNDTVIAIVGDHPDSFYENDVLGHAWIMDKHQRQTPYFLINGSGTYETPFGQHEIYNMIINSSNNQKSNDTATFIANDKKNIFLIGGTLSTPNKIGFIGVNKLETYDFSTGEYIPKHTNFKNLINYWEALILTKHNLH